MAHALLSESRAMNISLYQAASALDSNARWQEIIADNLASSSIPGFKKQELSVAAAEAGLLPMQNPNPANPADHFSLPHASATTSFASGEMKYTGVKTDVAIQGPAFFEVQLPNGQTAYTRDGEFQIDAQGQLVTKEGYLVLSNGGSIQLDTRNPAPLSISAEGQITQGTDPKGTLSLVEFKDPKLLTQISGGYFLAKNQDLQPTASTNSTVRQGYLEGANTTPVLEMANLMMAMRNFEANQRVIQMHDERLSKAIQELGNPN